MKPQHYVIFYGNTTSPLTGDDKSLMRKYKNHKRLQCFADTS